MATTQSASGGKKANAKPGFADLKDEVRAANPDLPDFDKWTPEQIGFAPYWAPSEGKFFLGTPVFRDERDPKFVRIQFVSAMNQLECQRGPNETMAKAKGQEVKKVMIDKGQPFSISVYDAAYPLFNEYLEFQEETGTPVVVAVKAIEKVPTNNDRLVWTWEAKVSPEQSAVLTQWRLARAGKRKGLTGGNAAEREKLED